MRRAVLVLAIVHQATVATAQPGLTPPGAPAAPAAARVDLRVRPPGLAAPDPRAPVDRPSGGPKRESVALALSLGGTLASYAIVIAAAASDNDGTGPVAGLALVGAVGAAVAPTFGHWYAGTVATRGLALRGAGLGAILVGAVLALDQCPLFEAESDGCNEGPGPTALVATGVGLFIAGTVDDIVTAPRRARDHNRRLRELAIVPRVGPDGAAVAVTGRW